MPCAASAREIGVRVAASRRSARGRRRGARRPRRRADRRARGAGRRCTSLHTHQRPPRAGPRRGSSGGSTTTLLRSCHSGWSKNVRSWIVTTHGTRGAQRHRVVRAVPHVGPHALPRAPAPRACSQASRAGRRSGARRARRRPARARAQRVVVAAARERCSSTSARAARPVASATVYMPGADRARGNRGDVEEDPHGAQSTSRSALRPGASTARCVRGDVRLGRVRPRELGGARAAARRRARLRSSSSSSSRSSASGARLDVAGREQQRGVADDLLERRALGDRERRAARERLERGEPESLVARRDAARGRAADERVDDRPRLLAEHAHERPVDALDAAPARRADDDELEVRRAARADALDRVGDRREVLARLDRADGEHVRRVDADARDGGVDVGVGARRAAGRRRAARRRTSSGLKPSRMSSTRVNDDGAITRSACRRATASARRWKLTPRRVVTCGTRRNAMSCTVTTSAASRTGGTARLGACTTSASMRTTGPAAAGASTRSARCRAARRGRSTGPGGGTPGGPGAGRERDDVDADRRAGRAAASGCSGRCRRAPVAAAGRRGTRPSSDLHLRTSRRVLREPAVARRRARGRSPATRTRRADRGRARRARRGCASSVSTRSSAAASPRSSVGSTSSAASPATSGIEPARAATTGTSGAHRFEQRKAEAFVDRRVGEHRRRVEQRAPARVVDVAGEHDPFARVGAGSRSIAASTAGRAGPSRPAITRRRSGWVAASMPNALTRCGRFLRGSSVAIASTNGRSADRCGDRRPACAAASPRRGTPSGITTSRPGAAQPGPEELLDLVGDELRAGVHRRAARDRPPHERHERAHLRRAQLRVPHERAVVDAHERRQPARRREVVGRVDRPRPAAASGRCAGRRRVPTNAAARVPATGRTACSGGTSARIVAGAQAERVRHERRRSLEAPAARRRSRRRRCRCRCARRAAA